MGVDISKRGISGAGGTVSGPILLPNGTASAVAAGFSSDAAEGMFRETTGNYSGLTFGAGSHTRFNFIAGSGGATQVARIDVATGFINPAGKAYAWASTTDYTSSADLFLSRGGSGLMKLYGSSTAAGFFNPPMSTAIASAATIAPTAQVFHVTGTTTISTITPPTGAASGLTITIIPDALFATNTAGNIALATTAVVGKALHMTWDATATKWYPSY